MFRRLLKWNVVIVDLRRELLVFQFSQQFLIEAAKHYYLNKMNRL
jgi:hypothetical protein